MKRYEYVALNGNTIFGAKYEKHREIIDEYAKKGFTFVGYIPTKLSSYGTIFGIDLIFEIECEDA